MTVLNFPDPNSVQTYTENNITYTWDGKKWKASGDDVYVAKSGTAMSGSVTVPERTITSLAFDLSTGPYWTCGAIDVPNPTNAVAGMGGLIRITDEPTSWGSYFKFPDNVAPTGTGTVPFYVESNSYICIGQITPGA